MVKRKRNEPRLEANLQKWEKELVRGLKTAKGFERQRYSKRQREADPEKAARLEREIAVLKVRAEPALFVFSVLTCESVEHRSTPSCSPAPVLLTA
jgi:hypothetical protein